MYSLFMYNLWFALEPEITFTSLSFAPSNIETLQLPGKQTPCEFLSVLHACLQTSVRS
jgi:hypothetical protein